VKQSMKYIILVLVVEALGVVIFLLARPSNRSWDTQRVSEPQVREENAKVIISNSMSLKHATQSKHSAFVVTNQTFGSTVVQKYVAKSFVPTEISTNQYINTRQSDMLLPIMHAVSNAVLSVDRILKSKNYKNVEQFNRTIWLESVDKAESTVWRISPTWRIAQGETNAVVGSINATVYSDENLTQVDPSRSYQVVLFPETGALRDFCWSDKHELLRVEPQGKSHSGYENYSKHLGGEIWLQIEWDGIGNLVSSNVYNWAVRGRVIDHSSK